MGIPLMEGRAFNVHDNSGSPAVAVINRALQKRYFPDQDPIGQTFDSEDLDAPARIVGVVADTRYADLREETPPTFYLPYLQRPIVGRMVVELRTVAAPFSVLRQVSEAVESMDRDLPLIDVRTQTQEIEATLSNERVFAELAAAFGVLALVLSSIGIYGIMAYTVARRTSEIGIRMALGAESRQVLGMVLKDSVVMALTGVVIGIGGALWLMKFASSMLYGLRTSDPITLAAAATLLILVALVAGLQPARRASRISPTMALRHE
jgi:predicted permease